MIKTIWCQLISVHKILSLLAKNFKQVKSSTIRGLSDLMQILKIKRVLKNKLKNRGGVEMMVQNKQRHCMTFYHLMHRDIMRAKAIKFLKAGLLEQIYRKRI